MKDIKSTGSTLFALIIILSIEPYPDAVRSNTMVINVFVTPAALNVVLTFAQLKVKAEAGIPVRFF